MREIQCKYWYKDASGNARKSSLTWAKFHCWGQDDIETADSVIHCTVGIVELDNGEVYKVNPEDIKFITELDKPRLVQE